MSLIICKEKMSFDQLLKVKTPEGTISHRPLPHHQLVTLAKEAIARAGFEIEQEEFGLARDGLRFFGGFALKGQDITANDRKLVFGLRNSNDKSFPAAACIGTSMTVCSNLSFSSAIKLARRHTTNIMHDLPRVLADAVGRCVSQWEDMGARIESYKQVEISKDRAADLLIDLVDAQALPAREIYNTIQEFRNPRHPEFKEQTLWSLYNGITQQLKGSDLSKLPFRTMVVESIFDRVSTHRPLCVQEIKQERESLVVIG
jgi:Domain of unknown function (DUF932)